MSMSKKDYELIARTIRDLRQPNEVARRAAEGVDDLTAVTNALAYRLRDTNPAFDPTRFREACRA